jgi:hypothetical protein
MHACMFRISNVLCRLSERAQRLTRATQCIVVLTATLAGSAIASTDQSFSARFYVPGSPIVQLDYVDEKNYRFATTGTGIETLVLQGRIYLVLLPRPPLSGTEGVFWYGELAKPKSRSLPSDGTMPLALRATKVPPLGVAAWGNVGAVGDVTIAQAGPIGIPIDMTVGRVKALAAAQSAIHERLIPAMNMSLCGDGINTLTAWWPPAITNAGYAVLATTTGVRLEGQIKPLTQRLSLPANMPIQDYRLPTAKP